MARDTPASSGSEIWPALIYGAMASLGCGSRTGLIANEGAPADASVAAPDTSPGSCDFVAVGDVFGSVVYFNGGAALPAGRYRVSYVDGCMRYSCGVGGCSDDLDYGWCVHADHTLQWWLVGGTTSTRFLNPPGTFGFRASAGAFNRFDECVNANGLIPRVEFDFPGGSLGLWLYDEPYSDNIGGVSGRSPTWKVSCAR